ncbi:MAG: hypothetical protein QOG42_1353 [Solirubrobacteraceae bacterium]|nr:hypothetical protein [Solirubrobacteraceae bacterium]
MQPALPDPSGPPRAVAELGAVPGPRSAALQRRALQGAIARAVREMRTTNGRRSRGSGPYGTPPAARA